MEKFKLVMETYGFDEDWKSYKIDEKDLHSGIESFEEASIKRDEMIEDFVTNNRLSDELYGTVEKIEDTDFLRFYPAPNIKTCEVSKVFLTIKKY